MVASIVGQYSATTTSVTVADTPQPGDVLVLMAAIHGGDYTLSSVAGCGATWAQNYYRSTQNGTGAMSHATMVWVGSSPNASGTITVTTTGGTIGLKAYLIRGTNGVVSSTAIEGDLEIGVPSIDVGAEQVVLNMGALFDNAPKYPVSLTPSTGWITAQQALLAGWTRVFHGWRVPQGDPEPHRLTASSAVGATSIVVQAVVGGPPTLGPSSSFDASIADWKNGAATQSFRLAEAQTVGIARFWQWAGDILGIEARTYSVGFATARPTSRSTVSWVSPPTTWAAPNAPSAERSWDIELAAPVDLAADTDYWFVIQQQSVWGNSGISGHLAAQNAADIALSGGLIAPTTGFQYETAAEGQGNYTAAASDKALVFQLLPYVPHTTLDLPVSAALDLALASAQTTMETPVSVDLSFDVVKVRPWVEEVLADSPASLWRFDDADTTVLRDSVGTANGTFKAGASGNPAPFGVQPLAGAAPMARGVPGGIRFGGAKALNDSNYGPSVTTGSISPGSAFTIEGIFCWFGFLSGSFGGGLWQLGSESNFMLRLGDIGLRPGQLNGFGFFDPGSAHDIKLGNTYHIAVTYDGATRRLYLNGELIASSSWSGSVSAGGLQAPWDYGNGRESNVLIMGMAFTPQALSAERIAAHAAGVVPLVSDVSAAGGAASSYQYEGVASLFDQAPQSKWLLHAATGSVQWSTPEQAILGYSLTSGNDAPERDPKAWTLSGSSDGGATWQVLDTRSGETFAGRGQSKGYVVGSPAPFTRYKFEVTQNNGDSNLLQLADLTTTATGPELATSVDAGLSFDVTGGIVLASVVEHVYTAGNEDYVDLQTTPKTGSLLVLRFSCKDNGSSNTSVTGCGATWTREAVGAWGYRSEVWVGRGATSAGRVSYTPTSNATGQNNFAEVFYVEDLKTDHVEAAFAGSSSGSIRTGPTVTAGPGSVVIDALAASVQWRNGVEPTYDPADGWTSGTLVPWTQFTKDSASWWAYRSPVLANTPHTVSHQWLTAATSASLFGMLVVGGPPATDLATDVSVDLAFETELFVPAVVHTTIAADILFDLLAVHVTTTDVPIAVDPAFELTPILSAGFAAGAALSLEFDATPVVATELSTGITADLALNALKPAQILTADLDLLVGADLTLDAFGYVVLRSELDTGITATIEADVAIVPELKANLGTGAAVGLSFDEVVIPVDVADLTTDVAAALSFEAAVVPELKADLELAIDLRFVWTTPISYDLATAATASGHAEQLTADVDPGLSLLLAPGRVEGYAAPLDWQLDEAGITAELATGTVTGTPRPLGALVGRYTKGDAFHAPIILKGLTGSLTVDLESSTLQPQEQNPNNADRSVWLELASQLPGHLTITADPALAHVTIESWGGDAIDNLFFRDTSGMIDGKVTYDDGEWGPFSYIRVSARDGITERAVPITWSFSPAVTDLQVTCEGRELDNATWDLIVSVIGAMPGEDVRFSVVGFPDAYTDLEADSDGLIVSGHVTLPEQLTPGTYILNAFGLNSHGSDSFSFRIKKPVPSRPTPAPADLPPYAVAQSGGVQRWVLQDLMPGGLGSWVMPINPATASSPEPERYLTTDRTVAADGQPVLWEGMERGTAWDFSGTLLTQADVQRFQQYAALTRRFYVIDQRLRARVVVLDDVELTAVRDANHPWAHKYTVKCQVLRMVQL